MNNRVEFCTCVDTKCPNHPSNHDLGCTPCVEKNLSQGEVPVCFFNKANPDRDNDTYFFEDFARIVKSKDK
ncbi:MAG: DUF6485 family protein [Anaerococcus sp.]|nr:DUF6485 family protein [Peptoniphilaceae bacterium]MDY3055085.1 DUF6485 family protein [Anaerococcus sp.]